jgi:O-antigen ligase
MKSSALNSSLKQLSRKAQVSLVGILEVILVAFFLVIASRYWSISEHVAYISLFAATALIAITRGITGPLSVRRFLPLIAFALFIGWSVLSASWSPSFHLSLGRVVTVALVAAIGVAIGFALKPETVAKGLVLGILFLVAHATLISGWHPLLAFLPHNALGSTTGSAEPGLFTNISDMTYLLGVGLVASISIALKNKSFALVAAPVILLFFLSALGIPQMTMFFAVAGAAVFGLMILHLRYANDRLRKILRVVYPAVVVVGVVIFWVFREPILRPLGEDPNLSGRTIIWDWYFEAFLWEPVIGIGWGNTYNWPLTPGDIYPTGGYFIAHNGFIDIGLVTGGVGVVLIVATLVLVFLRSSSLAIDRAKSLSYLFIPTLLTYIVISDIAATSLPRYIGVFLVGAMVGLVVSETTKSELSESSDAAVGTDAALRVQQTR